MTAPGTSLLAPEVLAALQGLKLRVRHVAEGLLSGLHQSPRHGQSVEFAEHKEYAPGDEIRRIDWKAWGKTDRLYVKRFEHETNLRAWLVVDASGSMGWRGKEGRLSKLEYASCLSGTIAWLMVRQQDAAGLLAVDRAVRRSVPPRAAAAHLGAVLDALAALEPGGETRLAAAADWLVERAARRASVVVFSDLLDPDEQVLRSLSQLRRRKHEVTVFHVLDPAEIEFPFDDPTLFLSMEDGRQVEAHPRDVRRGYLELVSAWLERVRRECAEADIDYVLARTDQALDEVLLPFLEKRERSAA
ncbi:MAG TPA: DUF58 domain-containing protein [Anaeromyxobacteraceae bacterium]|nr:DUF58 domain-containing protein [Anaeromyxobacteraceae bacterium]